AKPEAQSKKMPQYTQEQVTELVAKCARYARYIDADVGKPSECVEFFTWVRWMQMEQFATAGQAKNRAQEQSAEREAQANKMPQYTEDQLADLRVKCAPSINT